MLQHKGIINCSSSYECRSFLQDRDPLTVPSTRRNPVLADVFNRLGYMERKGSGFGKIIGGGMPVGAYGGREDIMRMVSPDGPVYQAGTLSGNPIATAAGLATLRILEADTDIYMRLQENTAMLADAVRHAAGNRVHVNQIGSLMSIFFTGEDVTDYDSATTADTKAYADYFGFMLDHGIYVAPSQFESMFVSDAHTDADIQKTIHVMQEYFAE